MYKDLAALIELQYFPPVRFFTKLVLYPVVYLEAQEHYVKGSYRNRCHISSVNGIQRLSIPLRKGKNKQMPVREVRIAYDEPWRSKQWHAIQSAYGNSPFFGHYAPSLKPYFFSDRYEHLFDLSFDLLVLVKSLLKLDCELKWTEQYQQVPPSNVIDLREKIHPGSSFQDPEFQPVYYAQVFEDRHGFQPDLSILDLLFCCGPESVNVLKRSARL